jgi:hypothetical protein
MVIYFNRLETVPFLRHFTVRETESTRAAVLQSTEAKRLEYCTDCYLAQISLWKVVGEHVLHCEESIQGLPYPGFKQKCSAAGYCQLQLPLFAVEPLWYGEQPNAIVRQLDFCDILYLATNKLKVLNTLLNSAEYIYQKQGNE